MQTSPHSVDVHLQLALEEADDETTQYHLREALQLRIAERTTSDDSLSV